MIGLWRWWVRSWSAEEPPLTLAIVRIAVGLTLLLECSSLWAPDVLDPLFTPLSAGGLATGDGGVWVSALGGPTAATAPGLLAAISALSVCLVVGLGGRLTSLLLLQALIALHALPYDVGGGVDRLLINVVFLLLLGQSTATLSVDCRLRTGAWRSQAPVRAFPRYLMVVQLVVLYVTAGALKTSGWGWPFPAVYRALQRPAYARWDGAWLADVYPLTQLGTAVTWWWEATFFVLGLWFVARRGVFGDVWAARARRWDLRWPYLGVGLIMHLSLLVMLNIGRFVPLTLCLYLAFVDPDEWTPSR